MKTISIHGQEVTISAPYAEGQTITEAEAKALNQTRAENVANNFRKRVKAALDGGKETLAEVIAAIASYDASYIFSAAASRGARSTQTPLEKESIRVGKAWLVAKLKEGGQTLKTYTEKNGKEYVEAKIAEIAATEGITAQAKKNLANASKAAEAVGVAL
jgi:hypothetical protein